MLKNDLRIFIKKNAALLLSICAVILLYAVLFALGVTCPIKHLFGISCTGCGMTRAWLCAVRLDFSSAFYYHPLWILIPFVLGFGIFLHIRRKRKILLGLIGVFAALMIAVYFIRLFGSSDIVTFAPETSLLFAKIIS